MSRQTGILVLLVASLIECVTSQIATEAPITWEDVWNFQTTLWIGLIVGIALSQIITLLCCCGCIYFCRRMAVTDALDNKTQPMYQGQPQIQAQPVQQPIQQPQQYQQQPVQQQSMPQHVMTAQPSYQPQVVEAPQQPVYVTRSSMYRDDSRSQPSTVSYYKNESHRPVVRTYSSNPYGSSR